MFEIAAQVLRSCGIKAALWSSLLLTVEAGCAGEGSYRLHLVFADDAPRASVNQVELFAIERGKNTCEEWSGDELSLDTLNVYSRLVVKLPEEGGLRPHRLTRVPARALLFLAEGRDGNGAPLLRGCTAANVRSGATVEVTVKLEWYCIPVEGGELVGNEKDDDCDGVTDECGVDGDCDDKNVCTLDLCENGVCHQTLYPNGLPCQDMDRCTRKDACAEGACRGEGRDCRVYSGQCRLGGCEERTGACVAQPVVAGLLCDDGLYCTVDEACQSGDCVGLARDCEDRDACTSDSCDEAQNRCEHVRTPRPGMEGPSGAPSCANGLDDDCDGLIDGNDPSCKPCLGDQECNDDNPCTTDICEAGVCKNRPVPDGLVCDDGRYCTIGDGCAAGVCLGAPRDCGSLSSTCGVGICAEDQDACAMEAKANGTFCDDGLFCTLADKCLNGFCRGMVNDCDDDSFCSTEHCNETNDQCQYTYMARPGWEGPQKPGSCTNLVDDDCDGVTDAADPNCVPCGSDAECADQNPCTADRCADGYCENTATADGAGCDDGDPCTLGDGCKTGVCTAGSARKDSDGDQYVDGQCPGGDDCDDGRSDVSPGFTEGPFGDATCADGLDNDCDSLTDARDTACLQCTTDPECDDRNVCTSDRCAGLNCENTPLPGTACDDVLFCNGSDTCDDSGACRAHTGNPCEPLACDEPADQCTAAGPDVQFVQLTAGSEHSCGLTADGTAYCWGSDGDGQLGDGGSAVNAQRPVMVDVSGITGSKAWVTLSAGWSHTCGLTAEGAAYCWGADIFGELGNGAAFDDSQSPVMVDVSGVTGNKAWVTLSAGGYHTCGLTAEGAAYCWGSDSNGELGNANGRKDSQSPIMVDVSGITGTKAFMTLTAGYLHTCGLTAEGAAYCWGEDGSGQLGNGGSAVIAQSPTMVDETGITGSRAFTLLSAGGNHTCGLTAEGVAYCWGRNFEGQIGDGSGPGNAQSPVVVDETGIIGTKALVTLATGYDHTCGMTAEGAAYCWGSDASGELGNGAGAPSACGIHSDPCAQSPVLVDISGMTGGAVLVAFSAGFGHTCGLTAEGAAYCWGWNGFGQLGNGGGAANFESPVVVDVSEVTGSKALVALSVGMTHSCGLLPDGSVYCWGSDGYGQLGNGGGAVNSQSPEAIDTLGVIGNKAMVTLAAGAYHACGLRAGGVAYCWGRDNLGQLGDGGSAVDAQSPVRVDETGITGSKDWVTISAGYGHTCGLTAEGVVYCWGYDVSGQLGNGAGAPTTCEGAPCAQGPVVVDVSVITGGKVFIAVWAGWYHTCGLTAEGRAYCWGSNNSGQLGNGAAFGDAQSPVAVDVSVITGSKAFVTLSAGWGHTCGVTAEGAAYCWGADELGQLGNGAAFGDTQNPVAIDTSVLTGNKVFVILSAGASHTCGVTAEGVAYCWGKDGLGQLGDGAGAQATCGTDPCAQNPVMVDVSRITGSSAFVTLSAGFEHSCGLTAEGAAYCWGWDFYGQLGNGGSAMDAQSPVAVDTSPL